MYTQKNKTEPPSYNVQKNQLEWVKGLEHNTKTVKFLNKKWEKISWHLSWQ